MAKSFLSIRRLSCFFLFIMATMAVFIYYKAPNHHKISNLAINGVFLATPKDIADFHLTDQLGRDFTKANLKGQWSLVFFGFTNCGSVCPTTLAALNGMYQTLQKDLPRAELPQVVFITLDRERDTTDRLKGYINAYNAHFIGARTDSNEAQSLLMRELNIVAAKISVEGAAKDHYSLDHSADILVFNPEGRLQAYLTYPHAAQSLVRDYESIVVTAALSPLVE